MDEYYDSRERPPYPPRSRRRQSTLSVALEALGGGLIIALIIVSVKRLMGS
jgi:hypothetical protein